MDNRYLNIFRKLREYFVSPGLNLWGLIRKRLFTSDFPHDKTLSLQDFEIQPPEDFFEKIIDSYQQFQIKNKFESLADYSVDVPEAYFERIIALIKNKKRRSAIIAKMPVYQKIVTAAAIVAVIVCIFWLFNKKENNSSNLVKATIDNNLPINPSDSTGTDTLNLANKNFQEKNTLVNNGKVNLSQKKITVTLTKITIDGIEIPIENNEILYSLTKYNNGRAVDWKQQKSLIQLGDYAGISVSPYIRKVIADLYTTKKNGKRTAKARRAASKIKRWRKVDMRSFDKKKNRNPLDIIDLGDNVY